MGAAKGSEIRSSRKSVVMGTVAGWLMSGLARTLRVDFRDESGLADPQSGLPPTIYALWHNRIFVLPPVWHRFCGGHRRAVALTSASHDGDVVARAMGVFGLQAVRGSSSRRGVAALVGLKRALRDGKDICITPDGPRGPRYKVQPGVIKLAESTGAPVVMFHVRFSSAWRIKSWDRLVIPKPFSRVEVVFSKPVSFERGMEPEAFEQARQNLELLLVDGADDA